MSDNWDVSPQEIKALRRIAISGGTVEADILHEIAKEVYPEIAIELEYSILRDVSYERMERVQYIPMSKANFYQYQRKAYNLYRANLKKRGIWELG